MKFSHLVEYNMRNIFLEKSSTKCEGETNPRTFFTKSKVNISLDQRSEFPYSLFSLYVQEVENYQNMLKLKCWPLAFNSYKALDILQHDINKNKSRKSKSLKSYVSNGEQEAIGNSGKRRDIIITTADKDGAVVIMNTDWLTDGPTDRPTDWLTYLLTYLPTYLLAYLYPGSLS